MHMLKIFNDEIVQTHFHFNLFTKCLEILVFKLIKNTWHCVQVCFNRSFKTEMSTTDDQAQQPGQLYCTCVYVYLIDIYVYIKLALHMYDSFKLFFISVARFITLKEIVYIITINNYSQLIGIFYHNRNVFCTLPTGLSINLVKSLTRIFLMRDGSLTTTIGR